MQVCEQTMVSKPRREKGTGTIWKKESGVWMGRVDIGKNAEGKRRFKNFSGCGSWSGLKESLIFLLRRLLRQMAPVVLQGAHAL